jgi:hypothetical protein
MLRLSALLMLGALILMLVTLARPTPRLVGLFLSAGLGAGAASVAIFLLDVVRELRTRRIL